jgi:hypothetical protein
MPYTIEIGDPPVPAAVSSDEEGAHALVDFLVNAAGCRSASSKPEDQSVMNKLAAEIYQ